MTDHQCELTERLSMPRTALPGSNLVALGDPRRAVNAVIPAHATGASRDADGVVRASRNERARGGNTVLPREAREGLMRAWLKVLQRATPKRDLGAGRPRRHRKDRRAGAAGRKSCPVLPERQEG